MHVLYHLYHYNQSKHDIQVILAVAVVTIATELSNLLSLTYEPSHHLQTPEKYSNMFNCKSERPSCLHYLQIDCCASVVQKKRFWLAAMDK